MSSESQFHLITMKKLRQKKDTDWPLNQRIEFSRQCSEYSVRAVTFRPDFKLSN